MSAPTLPDNTLLLWLQDENNNDYQDTESLQEMYNLFSSANADATDLMDLLKDDDRHHCFLIFNHDEEDNPVGTILHHLARYPRRMGVTTPFDNQWFIAAGSPVGGHQTTYLFPDDFMDDQDDVQVFTADRIQREIGNNPEASVLTVDANDANVEDLELVTTRHAMWLPNQYAALCLEEGLSPVEIWNRIYGVILQDGNTRSCKPLVNYLRVHLLGDVDANEGFFDPNELRQPRPGRSLIKHRQSVMLHMMPAGSNSTTGVASGGSISAGVSVADIQAIITTLQSGHTAPAPSAIATTNPSSSIAKRWSVNLDSLLLFTLSSTVTELEPLYSSIADAGRKLEKATIQAGYNNVARAFGAATKAPLTVTKDLTTTITEVIFWSGDLDRIDEGLHEFRTVYQSAAKTAKDQSAMQTYDLLAADGNLCLEDVQLFQHVLKSNWPTGFLQLDTTLKVHLNLLTLLLRPAHPLRTSYQTFINTWNGLSLQLAERFNTNPAMPAQFLRSVQLRTSVYWQAISSLTLNEAKLYPAPNYVNLINSLLIQTWVAPTIPGYVPIVPREGPRPVIQGDTGVGSPTPAAPPTPSGGGGPAPAPAPAPAQEPARRVDNTQRDPELVAAMEGRTFQIRSLFTPTVRPPRTTDNKEICCSFHYNGSCFTNCSRRNTHRPLPAADQTTLRNFAQEHIVQPDVGRPST